MKQVHITEKEKTLIAKNHHKMAERHRFGDESINREKNKNSNEEHVDKILEDLDLSYS